MRKRRVHQILSLFEPEEIKRFRAFLVSPLYDKNKSLLRFFELWEARVLSADAETGEISPEAFLKGSDFKLSRLDKLCSQLHRKALDFLALLEFEREKEMQMNCEATALERRGAPSEEIQRHDQRQRRWLQGQKASAAMELHNLQLHWRIARANARSRKTQVLWKEDFHELHERLDAWYYLQKLKLAAASANARHLYNQEEESPASFLHFFRQSVDAEKLHPLTRAYLLTLDMLTQEPAQDAFIELSVLLQDEADGFEEEEARELYHYALNFCIRKSNLGEEVYKEYTGKLYRDLLDKELVLFNGRLSAQTMKNIVVIHCRLGKLDWVQQFLEGYRHRLDLGADPATVTYNEAVLAFFRRDFRVAIDKLKEVVSQLKNDIFYELDARIYLWKSYFEFYDHLRLEEVDEMERMYDAFRVYIDRNNKISEVHKVQYRNFIREFRRLLRAVHKESLPQTQLLSLRQELVELEHTIGKEWFVEKVDELMTRQT